MSVASGSGSPVLMVSASAEARIQSAHDWLAGRERDRPLLVLAPTLGAASEVLRTVVCGRGAAFGWCASTLPRLAAQLAHTELAAAATSPVGRLACEAAVARVVHARTEAGDLGRYAPVADTMGFVRALTSTLLELRLAGLAAEDVADGDPELAELLDAYEAELSQARLADWPAVLTAASTVASADGLRVPVVLLDLLVRTRHEADFVQAIAAGSPDVFATVPKGDEATLLHLQAALECSPCDAIPAERTTALAELREHLFADHGPEQPRRDDSVTILSAPGENRECVEVVRRIVAFTQRGVRFDQMAVLLRSADEYRAHLEEALGRAGIPAYFERGVVRPDPAGRAFLVLLRCALEGLSAQRFAEYLSLAQVPDADGRGLPPAPRPAGERWVLPDQELVPAAIATALEPAWEDTEASWDPDRPVVAGTLRAPRRWEGLLVEAAVIGGIDRWQRRLDGLAHELRSKLEESDDDGDAGAVRWQRDLDDLDALATYALPLLEELAGLDGEANWDVWLDRLGALASRALRSPQRVLSVLGELAPMGSLGPVDLREVTRVLERHLLDLRIPPRGPRYGELYVAPTEAARGRSFDVVFVPGLAEKLFPRKIVEDPILLDRARADISRSLRTNQDRLADERLALRVAVGAARERVVLSFPRIDLEQARPRVPSFYALEAARAAEGRLPLFDELAKRAEMVTVARVGWPAPNERTDAIDNAEYDLAVLAALADLDPEQTLGAAHYLLDTNVYLTRALRFRARRWLRRWSAADGLWHPGPDSMAAMAEHRLDARSFSPTALQNFAACPYKFFLYTIHRLAPRQEALAIEDMDPLQRGSLVHDVQFELFSALRDDGLLPVRAANLDVVRARLDEVLSRVAARYRDDLAPAIERVWQDGVAAVRVDLREWLRRACEDDSGFEPWRFELSFGLASARARDPHSVAEPVTLDCGLRLRGSIDLVERRSSGELRVTDHKTGRVRVDPDARVDGGKSLQPILYALAVEKIFGGQMVESGRLYYCTIHGGFEEREVPLDEHARSDAQVVADTIGSALSDGVFPAAPEKGACRWCDYRPVCGPYEELRTGRKPCEPLADLRALRELR